MTMRTSDFILSKSRGDAATAIGYAREQASVRLVDVASYVSEVYRLAPMVSLDPSIIIAQSCHETDAWRSPVWETRLNPAGIGWTGDPAQNEASATWQTGRVAAQSHVAHLLIYAMGELGSWSRWKDLAELGDIAEFDDRRDDYVAAFGRGAVAERISDLTGKWAVAPHYAVGIVTKAAAIFPLLPDQEDQPVPDVTIGVPVTRIMLPAGASNRPGRKLPPTVPLYIVVHETANPNVGADARSQIIYLQSADARARQTSYHLSVDDHAIVQGVPLDENAWHAGDGCDDPNTDIGCFRSIAIEGCINRDGDEARMRRNYAELIARICAGDPAFDWGGGSSKGRFDINHIKQHIQVSTPGPNQHHCPDHMLNEGFWPTFLGLIDQAWAKWEHVFSGTPSTTTTAAPKPSPYAEPDTAWMEDDKPGKRTDHSLATTVGGEMTQIRVFALERPYEALKGSWRYLIPDSRGAKVGPKLKVREKFVGSYYSSVKGKGWIITPNGSWILASALTPRASIKAA